MSDQSPIIVPMSVEALVVNDFVRPARSQIVSFLRTQMSYNAMQSGGNGQPFFSGNQTNFINNVNVPPNNVTSSAYYNGVYLKWRMPKALATGTQDNVSGQTTYPQVPNRWLVVRYSGPLSARVATSWIIESDYLHTGQLSPMNVSQEASLYTQPTSATNSTPVGVYIGRNVQLGTWVESNQSLNLTAMAPGNPAFGFYQPQNNNVFSFVDCLEGQAPELLSYLVFGWYSNGADDPLAPGLASFQSSPYSGYASTLTFSAASAVDVQWTAGVITAPNGTAYNIAAGTTGAMTLPVYIYLNPAVSATTLQVTTTEATAQAPGCVLVATATPFFVQRLASLGWTLPPGADPSLTASWSVLCGAVDGVSWQNSALPPGGAPTPTSSGIPLSIAVGNTSAEALTALVASQANKAGKPIYTDLLEAFQLNALDVFDRPDGAAVLAEKVLASFFQRFSGGYEWSIVDAANDDTTLSEAELAKEAAWLAALNQAQQALDLELNILTSLQTQLYVMWWKVVSWNAAYFGSSSIPCLADENGQEPSSLTNQLNPAVPGSLAQLVAQQLAKVETLAQNVPTGTTPDALDAAIAAYAAKQALPASRLLKRGAAPSYYLPNNPVVLIAGAGASGIAPSPDTIQVRFPSQIVTGFTLNGPVTASTPNLTIPQPSLTGVSGVPWSAALATSLVNEFFFLDLNNAGAIATAIGATEAAVLAAMPNTLNVAPKGAVEQWSANPWRPLLFYWQANFYPIAYGTPAAPNWVFEGTQYSWNGSASSVAATPMGFQGLSVLAPTAAFNMEARIQQFLANNPNLDPREAAALEALLDFVQTSDNWDLLSQSLDGFNEQLRLGTPGVFLSPGTYTPVSNPPLSKLIGSADSYPPALGDIPPQGQDPAVSQFQPWRAGQFVFTNLALVDEWGQALWPVTPNNNQLDTIFLPPDLSPVLNSNPVSLTVTANPMVDGISPNVAAAGGPAFTLTVTGINFAASAAVQWNGAALATTFVNAGQLTAVVPANLIASAGSASVTVLSGGVTTTAIPFPISSGPVIGSLSPSLIEAGSVPSDTLALTVTGAGFAAGALVNWNGVAVNTEVVNSTTLTAAVPAGFTFAYGQASITVVQGAATSAPATINISGGAAIGSLTPALIATGSPAATLTVNGVGFQLESQVRWNGAPLATAFVSDTQLTAQIPANLLASAASVSITESVGARVLPNSTDPLVQLPPALLQPARLDFALVSAVNDNIPFGPANPGADPIAGWVVPNHLDNSLMAYDSDGIALGEMSVSIAVNNASSVCWANNPFSPYKSLKDINDQIPHLGPFLMTLSKQTPAAFQAFLDAIDETLWTTVPMGASFDQSLAVLIGRPLAMVRAKLQFLLDGPPYLDPSWQYTFNPANCSQPGTQTPAITGYEFGIELGNIAQLEDGLIGYFCSDDYSSFNVVDQSGAASGGYLKPIGLDNNYIYLPFDGATAEWVSMLVDPRAGVHASTAILPATTVSLPPNFTNSALARMNVLFRVDGVLTDQQPPAAGATATTILLPVPKEKSGTWTWVEQAPGGWTSSPTGPNDTVARLSSVGPVLRRGMLQLSSALGGKKSKE